MANTIKECGVQVHGQLEGKEEAELRSKGEEEGVKLVVYIPIDGSDAASLRHIQRNRGGASDATIQKSKLKIKTEEDKITEYDEEEDISAHGGNQVSVRDNVNGYNNDILPSQARNSDLSSLPQSPSQPKAQEISLEITINEEFSQAKPPTCNAVDAKYGSLSEKHDSYCLSTFSSSSFSLSSTNSSTISDLLVPIGGEENSGFDPEQRSKPRFRLLTELYKTQHENVASNYHSLKRHSSRRES